MPGALARTTLPGPGVTAGCMVVQVNEAFRLELLSQDLTLLTFGHRNR